MTSSSDAEKRRNLCRWRTSAAAHPISKRGCAKATCWRCRISASEVTAGMACSCSCVSFPLRTCSPHTKVLREACRDAAHDGRPGLQLLLYEFSHLQQTHQHRMWPCSHRHFEQGLQATESSCMYSSSKRQGEFRVAVLQRTDVLAHQHAPGEGAPGDKHLDAQPCQAPLRAGHCLMDSQPPVAPQNGPVCQSCRD